MYKTDDCPRGFHFCNIKKECVPDRAEAKDKLMQRSQRYFFKTQEAEQLVDIALDEGFETFTKIKAAEKKVDEILSECGGCGMSGMGHKMTPEEYEDHERAEHGEDDPEDVEAYKRAYYGDDYEEEAEFDGEFEQQPSDDVNDINHVPNQDAEGLMNSVQKQLGESENITEGAIGYRLDFEKIKTKCMAKRFVDKKVGYNKCVWSQLALVYANKIKAYQTSQSKKCNEMEDSKKAKCIEKMKQTLKLSMVRLNNIKTKIK